MLEVAGNEGWGGKAERDMEASMVLAMAYFYLSQPVDARAGFTTGQVTAQDLLPKSEDDLKAFGNRWRMIH